MDQVYITGVGHLLILVDSFSGWPEVIWVPDKKSSTIKQIQRVIFPERAYRKPWYLTMHQNLVMNLILWLEKIGCKPYKTPPFHPQSNGWAEKMVQTIKMRLKACSQQKEKNEVFLPKLLLSYCTIPLVGRLESPSALMGRQIKAPLTMSFPQMKKYSSKRTKNQIQKGQNLSRRKATTQLW